MAARAPRAGKYMLAHAASAQGISAVENMCGRPHELNHLSVPAACFTHPEVSFVGLTEDAAREAAAAGGYGAQVVKTSFKANSKARGAGLASMCCRVSSRVSAAVCVLEDGRRACVKVRAPLLVVGGGAHVAGPAAPRRASALASAHG